MNNFMIFLLIINVVFIGLALTIPSILGIFIHGVTIAFILWYLRTEYNHRRNENEN